MKNHRTASKRKHPYSMLAGCGRRCKSSTGVPFRRTQVGLQSDMDCNPKAHDNMAAVYSALSSEIEVKLVLKTPEKPNNSQFQGDSLLESVPMDLLVMDAKTVHLNFVTPDRTRQQVLKGKDLASMDKQNAMPESPQCPGAPVHGRACIYLQR